MCVHMHVCLCGCTCVSVVARMCYMSQFSKPKEASQCFVLYCFIAVVRFPSVFVNGLHFYLYTGLLGLCALCKGHVQS